MLRVFLCAVLSLMPVVAVSAPVPPPTESELLAKHWGKIEGQGDFTLAGKELTIRTTGQPARGYIHGKQMNMPRISRTATGDFEATVKLVDASAPNPKHKHEDSWPGTRAGIIVSGGGYSVEYHLYQYYPKFNGEIRDQMTRTLWIDTWFPGGGAGNSLVQVPPGKSVYLRITRQEKVITVSHSFDGKEWSKPFNPRRALDFSDEVTVGVFFSHSTHQFATATFDNFTIEKPKAMAEPQPQPK